MGSSMSITPAAWYEIPPVPPELLHPHQFLEEHMGYLDRIHGVALQIGALSLQRAVG